MTTIWSRRKERAAGDTLTAGLPIARAAEAARHARRGIDITTVEGIPGDPHRPAGSPSGPCGQCGCRESRKLSRILTGVYSDYPLCADFTACLERQRSKPEPALVPLPEPERAPEPEPELSAGDEPRGVACGHCEHTGTGETAAERLADLRAHVVAEHSGEVRPEADGATPDGGEGGAGEAEDAGTEPESAAE